MASENANLPSLETDVLVTEELYLVTPPGIDSPAQGSIQIDGSGKVVPLGEEFAFADNITVISSGTYSVPAATLFNNLHHFRTNGAAATDTLPDATDLIALMSDQSVGSTIRRRYTASGADDVTLVLGAGMTGVSDQNLDVFQGTSVELIFEIASSTTMNFYMM